MPARPAGPLPQQLELPASTPSAGQRAMPMWFNKWVPASCAGPASKRHRQYPPRQRRRLGSAASSSRGLPGHSSKSPQAQAPRILQVEKPVGWQRAGPGAATAAQINGSDAGVSLQINAAAPQAREASRGRRASSPFGNVPTDVSLAGSGESADASTLVSTLVCRAAWEIQLGRASPQPLSSPPGQGGSAHAASHAFQAASKPAVFGFALRVTIILCTLDACGRQLHD